MGFSKEELEGILEAISEAYEAAGKKIVLGELITEEGSEILVDNREDKHNN